jgi:hypothetical protein
MALLRHPETDLSVEDVERLFEGMEVTRHRSAGSQLDQRHLEMDRALVGPGQPT